MHQSQLALFDRLRQSLSRGSAGVYLRGATVAAVLAAYLAIGGGIPGIGGWSVPTARAYSCVNPHCYGEVIWPGNVHGAASSIFIAHLYCIPSDCYKSGNWSNEFWVGDDKNYFPCKIDWEGACYVEDGYATDTVDPSDTYEIYFWADYRSIYGGQYNFHDFGDVPSGDYGNYSWFQVSYASSGTWDVYVSSNNFYEHQQSTSNDMEPSDIRMGAELSGTVGASADRAYFTLNEWEGTDNTWHYQTVNGTPDYNNPPYVGWVMS